MSNRALAFTADLLLQILQSSPSVNSYLVGYSGGADSTALLHALGKIQKHLGVPVSAVHVNHGIHADADLWQQQCVDFCRHHSIELTCLNIHLKNRSGKGLEAEARHLRYEAISGLLSPGDCLLTAHHADDQAETLLLNLMRGSGVDGLTAMPGSRPLGDGILRRPLLHFTNSALRDYLSENGVEWAEDPSNQCLNHDRNFVRHEVIPLLEQRWPEVTQRLLLTQDAMTDARHLLEKLADDYLEPNLGHPFVLHVTPQCITEPELLRLVIRRWLKKVGVPGIPVYKLGTFCDQVQRVVSDHNVSVHWDGWLLHLYKNQLWLQIDVEIQPCPALNWPGGQREVDLGNDVGQILLSSVVAEASQPARIEISYPDGEFSVGGRKDQEEAIIDQGGFHKSLKKVFQAANIPSWLRDSIPLCNLDGELVAVGDWCFADGFANWLSENNISLNWRPRHPLLQFIRKQQHRGKH